MSSSYTKNKDCLPCGCSSRNFHSNKVFHKEEFKYKIGRCRRCGLKIREVWKPLGENGKSFILWREIALESSL